MKTVMKKLLSIMLVAILLVSAVPFAASAAEVEVVENSQDAAIMFYVVDANTGKEISQHYVAAGTYTKDQLLAAFCEGEYEVKRWYGIGDKITAEAGDQTQVEVHINPIETNGKQLATLKVVFNNDTSDYVSFDVYFGDNILDAIKAYGVKLPAYADHKFVGWSFIHTADASEDVVTIYSTVNEENTRDGICTIWADWEPITDDDDEKEDVVYDAVLKIYTNGTTSKAAKTVDLDAYSIEGQITRAEVEAAVQKYYKAANNNGMSFYGLFTSTDSIANYKTATGVTTVKLDANKTTTIYVMVTNATAITTNTNNNTASDPTNPQTGDMIGVSLALMMSTGGAALLLGKKRNF